MNPEEDSAAGRNRSQLSHHEVADVLRARIRSGELAAGTRLPTQAHLAEEFGVERATVRRALHVLQDENLLTQVSRGSPPVVADAAAAYRLLGPEGAPQPTTVSLGPRIADAFAVPHVEIDALCLTAGSLTLAIGEPLRQIHAGRIKPAKIDVRVLLPNRHIDLAFPAPVIPHGDDRLHRRWLAQRNAQGQVLRHSLRALRSTHGIDAHVTFRALPFTPPVKLYLLNRTEALLAFYTLAKRGEQLDGEEYLELYDAQGTRSMLFPFGKAAGLRDISFVEQSQLWFDALWGTISSDLELTE